MIGLGGGATAGAVSRHAGVDVDVVELSDSVVRGAARFAHVNNDILRQPHVRVHVSDGRNYLALTQKRYDVITADIIQPQHAGAGLVYSREYFELARAALKDDGIMLQWIGHRSKVEYDLIKRTFLQVFPEATLWNGGTLMVGTKRPLRVSRSAFERKLRGCADRRGPARGGTGLLGRAHGGVQRRCRGDALVRGRWPGAHRRPPAHRVPPIARGREVMVDLGGFRGEGREQIEAP